MDTAQKALFKAMLSDGWFTASEGETDSPTGFFGYVINTWGDYKEVEEAFADTISTYGHVVPNDFYGAFTAVINDQGVIRIVKWDNKDDAKSAYDRAVEQYEEWAAS